MIARALPRLWFTSALLAIASLILSLYVGYRYVRLIDCLADRDAADQRRTSAIAEATDAERAADLRLIRERTEDARNAALAARVNTDHVRAQYPAPAATPCG